MKTLHVMNRVCHYIALWLFVLSAAAYLFLVSITGSSMLLADPAFSLEEVATYVYSNAFLVLVLVVVATLHLVASILFRQLRDRAARRCCECGCGKERCRCGEPVKTNLDEQVEEVLKWKNLYVEGIITEREFIDKRNEILRISK